MFVTYPNFRPTPAFGAPQQTSPFFFWLEQATPPAIVLVPVFMIGAEVHNDIELLVIYKLVACAKDPASMPND